MKEPLSPTRRSRRESARFLLPLVLGAGALVLLAAAQPDDQDLRDQLALTELSHRYAWAIDTMDRELLAQVFTPDAQAHYVEVGPKVLGLDARLDGFDEIHAWLESGLGHRKGPAGLPWHFMSNHLIELDGDRAKMRFYMHNRPLAAGGVYYVDAVRTPEGWRMARLRLEEQTWKAEAYEGSPQPELRKGAADDEG